MLVLLAQVFGMNYLDQLLGTIHVVSNALIDKKVASWRSTCLLLSGARK